MAQHSHHDSYTVQAPRHPVSQLQGPFEESMLEAAHDEPEDIYLDPIRRRNTLLEAPVYTRVVAGRWKQKPGERFHPLWKLIAQISFGIHLLAEGMAKSEDEVMQILQAHVDEIDGFLERTTEDFDLAQEDIQERLRCLKLPLSHPATFDKMLEDRNFRLSIVEGNEKIEHIVERTSQAMKDSLKDVQKGFDSTSCLETYLQRLSSTWQRQSVEHEAVFVAMLGNVEGWRKAFMSLHMQGNKLGGSLKKLTDIINEMQARAGEVSRRLLHQARVQHQQVMGRPTRSSTPTSRFQTGTSKELPSIQDRPALRQTASRDTVRTVGTMRTSSQDSLRQHAHFTRSQTPQHQMPAPRQINNTASPRIVQMGLNSQGRVQSMVPSLMEAATPSRETLVSPQSETVDEEEQPERFFPPIELPAHLPEETMRTIPMSKQNRLSVGLGLDQASKMEKRNSRLGTSALVDLLRSDARSSKIPVTPKSGSPGPFRGSLTMPSGDSSSAGNPAASIPSQTRSSSASDPLTAQSEHKKRHSKKGVQYWANALDDDLLENDKFPAQDSSQHVASVAAEGARGNSDHGSGPSTPSWAVTTFAQVEQKKELLKNGAFSSHPPSVPLGSPPVVQSSFQATQAMTASQRRPSHASSTGQTSLGEPGPEVAASETGSVLAYPGRQNQTMKRASAYAPEVVVSKAPLLPAPNKQFIAEMEGSSPVLPGIQRASSSIRDVVMELEAPQQYFKLPPRPKPAKPTAAERAVASEPAELGAYQQHFRLPPRPQPALQVAPTDTSESPKLVTQLEKSTKESPGQQATGQELGASNDLSAVFGDASLVQASSSSAGPSQQEVELKLVQDQSKPKHFITIPDGKEVVQQAADLKTDELQPSNKVFVSTPDVPLPPSPYDVDHAELEPEQPLQTPPQQETLFFLPALAYKPPSPQLPPDPTLAKRKAELEPEPGRGTPATAAEGIPEARLERTSDALKKAPFREPSASLSLAMQHISSEPGDEYDPYRATGTTVQRDSAQLEHTRNTGSTDAANPWKAFLAGQPSPVGSNLSTRSMQRTSLLEHPSQSPESSRSPALLIPASASSPHTFHTPPVASPDAADSAKETGWFNRPSGRSSVGSSVRHEQEERRLEQDTKVEGLGIMT
ncbi:hypothetical protein LTR70_002667 [Exophiala xenobiotica]|uniref:Uncharacterized protein n=1 Tax=Lithohypha guttulata TaxID=1690604 RepID=A0ABR0KJE8_9EURO|nr:hypothetical protein LTR24_001773 [Lithohypha guttulata]KAK5324594.1 hypothetical protein LTR70_002667 [Exophiala xenobiotica]